MLVLSAQTYGVESTDYLLPSTGTEIGLLCSREMCLSSLLNIAEWPSKMMCQLTHPPVFHKSLLLFSLFLNSLFCSSFIVFILAYHHTVSISMLPDWLYWFLQDQSPLFLLHYYLGHSWPFFLPRNFFEQFTQFQIIINNNNK